MLILHCMLRSGHSIIIDFLQQNCKKKLSVSSRKQNCPGSETETNSALTQNQPTIFGGQSDTATEQGWEALW